MRWFFFSVLLLALGLWIACLFARFDLYLFQHGARVYLGNRWEQRCHIFRRRALWVEADFNHVSVNYEALPKDSEVPEEPRFVTGYPTARHAAVPYVENRREPEPDAVEILSDGHGHQLGPPHKFGFGRADEQTHTVVVGIPQWLIVLLAAVIPSIQLAKWWRRRRENDRGRGFAVES